MLNIVNPRGYNKFLHGPPNLQHPGFTHTVGLGLALPLQLPGECQQLVTIRRLACLPPHTAGLSPRGALNCVDERSGRGHFGSWRKFPSSQNRQLPFSKTNIIFGFRLVVN